MYNPAIIANIIRNVSKSFNGNKTNGLSSQCYQYIIKLHKVYMLLSIEY